MAYDDQNIFAKILRGEIPCDKVYENDHALAFRDIAPQAPVHVLVIPKLPIVSIAEVNESHGVLMGKLMVAAAEVARLEGVDKTGYRLVVNHGDDGGQTVFHLHMHVIGGRKLSWPPG